jgi:hypothetical protein
MHVVLVVVPLRYYHEGTPTVQAGSVRLPRARHEMAGEGGYRFSYAGISRSRAVHSIRLSAREFFLNTS